MPPTNKYPQRSCRQPVWGESDAAYSCDLKVDNLGMSHPGPCASQSVPASMQRRHVWEQSAEGQEALSRKPEDEEGWTS